MNFKSILELFCLTIFLTFINSACSDSSVKASKQLSAHKSFDSFKQGADPGPFIGGGGGEVMVCFESEKIRDESFAEDGSILDHARNQILQIYSYDIIEQGFVNHLTAFPQDNETPVHFLTRHLEDMFKFAPNLALKLGTAIYQILDLKKDVSAWKDVGALPVIGDSGKRWDFRSDSLERIKLFCRPFQIVHRIETYEKGNVLPKIEIKYDKDLFERLYWMNEMPFPGVGHRKNAGIYHQAVLILHEALYLLTSSLGATDSFVARQLVPHVLFDFNFFNQLAESKNNSTPLERARANYNQLTVLMKAFGFKDYPRAFLPELKMDTPVISTLSFANAYADLIDKRNGWLLKQTKNSTEFGFMQDFITQERYSEAEALYLSGITSDIEAFIYSSEIIWMFVDVSIPIHFESMFFLEKDADLKLVATYYCRHIRDSLDRLAAKSKQTSNYKMFQQADDFCETSIY